MPSSNSERDRDRQREESGEESDGDVQVPVGKKKKEKNRRPADTPFRQQRLAAYHPILTYKTIIPIFFVMGLIFGPLGGLFLYSSAKVNELEINYTNCKRQASKTNSFSDMPSSLYKYHLTKSEFTTPRVQWRTFIDEESRIENDNVCQIRFTIPPEVPFGSPVYFYYKLTNFHQNHRRYVKSFSREQLGGDAVPADTLKTQDTCSPLVLNPDGKPYYPCGVIANSMFNDTFSSPVRSLPSGRNVTYQMSNKGIAWKSDREQYGPTQYDYRDIVPPPHWVLRYPNNYTEDDPPPNLQDWEEFQVWMRAAALSTFTKLALRNDTVGMRSGTYTVTIHDRFEVTQWKGTKSILITTRTVMGGKNNFLGIAYIVVASICVLLGAAVTARNVFKPRALGDENYLTWKNEHPSKRYSTISNTGQQRGNEGAQQT